MNTATKNHSKLDKEIELLRKEMEILSLEKKQLEKELRAQAQVRMAEANEAFAEQRRKEAEKESALLKHALFYGYVTSTKGSVRAGPKPVRAGPKPVRAGLTVEDLIANYHIDMEQFFYQVTSRTAHWDRNCPAIKGKKHAHRVQVKNCLTANACSKCCNF